MRASFFEQLFDGGGKWCTSTARLTVGLGGMSQQGLDGGRVAMNACRVVDLSGTVATSMASLIRIMLWSLS